MKKIRGNGEVYIWRGEELGVLYGIKKTVQAHRYQILSDLT